MSKRNLLESIGSLKLTNGAINKLSIISLSEENKHYYSDANEFILDYVIQIDENVIGYGFNFTYPDDIDTHWGLSFQKFNEDVQNKISYLSREFPSAFCFFVEADQIVYMPHSVNHDIIVSDIIVDINLFSDIIERRNREICDRIKEEKMAQERETFFKNQTHFNDDQIKTIRTIFAELDDLDKNGFTTGVELYIFSTIKAIIVLYPFKNSPLGDFSRYFFINKRDEGVENFNEITYSVPQNLSSKFIAGLSHHHNPNYKKRVSKEQLEDFMNRLISFDDLKHLY